MVFSSRRDKLSGGGTKNMLFNLTMLSLVLSLFTILRWLRNWLLLLCKQSVIEPFFYFYFFIFLHFWLLCSLLILHFGKWTKTACQTEVVELRWPRGGQKKLWESEWTAFIVTTSKRNVLKDLVTLSLALNVIYRASSKYSLSLFWFCLNSIVCFFFFEPMKESDETLEVVYWFDMTQCWFKSKETSDLFACVLHLVLNACQLRGNSCKNRSMPFVSFTTRPQRNLALFIYLFFFLSIHGVAQVWNFTIHC